MAVVLTRALKGTTEAAAACRRRRPPEAAVIEVKGSQHGEALEGLGQVRGILPKVGVCQTQACQVWQLQVEQARVAGSPQSSRREAAELHLGVAGRTAPGCCFCPQRRVGGILRKLFASSRVPGSAMWHCPPTCLRHVVADRPVPFLVVRSCSDVMVDSPKS